MRLANVFAHVKGHLGVQSRDYNTCLFSAFATALSPYRRRPVYHSGQWPPAQCEMITLATIARPTPVDIAAPAATPRSPDRATTAQAAHAASAAPIDHQQ